MRILGIDPGNVKSAWLILGSDGMPDLFGIDANNDVLLMLQTWGESEAAHVLAIEYMQPRGMPTSKEEMDTQFFAGRCVQAWGGEWSKVFRADVKLHLCGQSRAKDANVRQALIDKFGGDSIAIGGKKCQNCKGKGWSGRGRLPCEPCGSGGWLYPPGPLAGITADCWSALAVAVTHRELNEAESQ